MPPTILVGGLKPFEHMLVKLDHFPKVRGEKKNSWNHLLVFIRIRGRLFSPLMRLHWFSCKHVDLQGPRIMAIFKDFLLAKVEKQTWKRDHVGLLLGEIICKYIHVPCLSWRECNCVQLLFSVCFFQKGSHKQTTSNFPSHNHHFGPDLHWTKTPKYIYFYHFIQVMADLVPWASG